MAKATLPVLEMSCVVCAGNVERTVSGLDGVVSASVNFAANNITVDYDPKKISLQDMKAAVQAAGYDLVIDTADSARQEAERNAYIALRNKLVVAWVLAVPVMALSMWGKTIWTEWAAAVMATVLLAYSGMEFYTKAWKMAKAKSANMDTLVAMSTAVAWLFSMFLLIFPDFSESHGMGHYVYFDSATMIVAFVLTGRLLEERAKNSTTSAIRSLMDLQPPMAWLVGDDGTEKEVKFNGQDQWVRTEWEVYQLPEAVKNALAAQGYTPDDREFDYVETPDSSWYEVEVRKGRDELKLYISPTGEILRTEYDD